MFAHFVKNVLKNGGNGVHQYNVSRKFFLKSSSWNLNLNKIIQDAKSSKKLSNIKEVKLESTNKTKSNQNNSNNNNYKKNHKINNNNNNNKNKNKNNNVSNKYKNNVNNGRMPAISIAVEEDIIDKSIINFDLNSDFDDVIFAMNVTKKDRDLIIGNESIQTTTEFSKFASSFSNNQFLSSSITGNVRQQNDSESEFDEAQIAKRNFQCFIHILMYNDNLSAALPVLLEFLSKYSQSWNSSDIESCCELLVKGWARKGSTDTVAELLKFIRNELKLNLNVNFYEYYLLSMSKQIGPLTKDDVKAVVNDMRRNKLSPELLFHHSTLNQNEILTLKKFLRDNDIFIFYATYHYPRSIDNTHIRSILSQEQQIFEPFKDINYERIGEWVQEQFAIEKDCIVRIPQIKADFYDVEKKRAPAFYKERLRIFEAQWKDALTSGFKRYLKKIENKKINGIPFIHFMTVLDEEEYVDIMLDEIRKCASFSEYYSPFAKTLFEAIGKQVMQRYMFRSDMKDHTLQDFARCYKQYIEYTKSPLMMKRFNSREYWIHLLENGYHYYFDETKLWRNIILQEIGKDLYELISSEAKFDSNSSGMGNSNISSRSIYQPVLSFVYTTHDIVKTKLDVSVHPLLIRLYNGAETDIYFEPERIPMLCPPVPWITPMFGGNLLRRSFLVRAPQYYPKHRLKKCPSTQLFPTYDSLNALGLIPWRINNTILDLAIEIFKNKGNLELDIPTTLSSFPSLPVVTRDMTPQERYQIEKKKKLQKKEQAEMYSLWADCQYKLSISNHLRDRVFWFPINTDFRSRVYPIPPNFNHLGSDLSRALLLFAKGKPLGEDGLRWLKIHLINLTGFKKRCSTDDRLKYCEEVIDLIMDSADNPFTGKKWWMDSDEKWQTLACCIELTRALRSGDPHNYISHIPIHQDGSCNGLQHYAALGRDVLGAKSVNLAPSDVPQDVYSDVAALVEIDIEKDFNNDIEIAKIVKGHISRKIVKQTVMTYVYGVTKYGAKLQVMKRLKEDPNFPKDHYLTASLYISGKILESISKMFKQTRVIQDWLTNCAQIISCDYSSTVEWITPMGFPVIQSYYKTPVKNANIKLVPNPMKQKNAFPANFIHSLDSTHMMLTSLECQRNGLTFASVHDCYWTHACDVHLMNTYCRRQFVRIHSEPILDQLADHLRDYVNCPERSANVKNHHELVGYIHKTIPKGDFDLRSVLESEFFFS